MMSRFAAEEGPDTALELLGRALSARPWLVYVNAPDDKAAVRAERRAVLEVGGNAWKAAPEQERRARFAGSELAMAGALARDLRDPGKKPESPSKRMDAGDYVLFFSIIALIGWVMWLLTAPLR